MQDTPKYLSISEIEELPFIFSKDIERGHTILRIIVYNNRGIPIARISNNSFDVGKFPRKLNVREEIPEPELEEDIAEEAIEPFLPIPWKDLALEKFTPQQWVIDGLIPRQGLVILASASGEKKTWIALEMARCIAAGINFLGIEGFKTEKRNVLYIDHEMSRSELQRRAKLLKFASEESVWIVSGLNGLDFGKEENVAKLYEFVQSHDIGVVFIDTLRAVAGGLQENDAEKVRAFFNLFKKFKDIGVAVVFLDHCRKPRPNEGREPKKDQLVASQDKVASVEVLLMLKSVERSEEIFIYPRKNRNGMERAPFKVIMKNSLGEEMQTIGVELNFGGEIDERTFKKDEAKELILSVLDGGGKKTSEIIQVIGVENHIGEKNIRNALTDLAKGKLINYRKEGRENFYFLTDKESVVENESEDTLFP